MITVQLGGTLQSTAGGKDAFELEARNVKEMLEALVKAEPKLAPAIKRGVSVAIDGQLYRDATFKALKPENEIVLLPRLAGG